MRKPFDTQANHKSGLPGKNSFYRPITTSHSPISNLNIMLPLYFYHHVTISTMNVNNSNGFYIVKSHQHSRQIDYRAADHHIHMVIQEIISRHHTSCPEPHYNGHRSPSKLPTFLIYSIPYSLY